MMERTILMFFNLAFWMRYAGGIVPSSEKATDGSSIASKSLQLEQTFARLARDEMGVLALQAAFDTMEYKPRPTDQGQSPLDKLVDRFSTDLRDYKNLVTSTLALAVRLHRSHQVSPIAPRFDCCNLSERDLRPDSVCGCRVSHRKCCDLIPRGLPPTAFNPGHNLTDRFEKLHDYWPNVKWFYFITADGLHTEFPAHNFNSASNLGWWLNPFDRQSPGDAKSSRTSSKSSTASTQLHCHTLHQLRHRDTFVRSVVPKPIKAVIIVDQGEASQTQLLLAYRSAQLILASLCEKDQVAILLASETVRLAVIGRKDPADAPSEPSGMTGPHLIHFTNISSSYSTFFPVTTEAKYLLNQLITSVHRPIPVKTNHTLALASAFKLFEEGLAIDDQVQLFDRSQNHLFLAYISRGYLSDIKESSSALRAVAEGQKRLQNRVRIGAYMTIEEKSATVLFERKFMQELAIRWSTYSLSHLPEAPVGHYFAVNRSTDLIETVGQFYKLFSPDSDPTPTTDQPQSSNNAEEVKIKSNASHLLPAVHYSLPHHDLEGGGLVMSISQAFHDETKFIGVMGLDVHLADLTDHVIHFSGGSHFGGAGSSRAFIVHSPGGYAVVHPSIVSQKLNILTDSVLFDPLSLASLYHSYRRNDTNSSLGSSKGRLRRSAAANLGSSSDQSYVQVDIGLVERVPSFHSLVQPALVSQTQGEKAIQLNLTLAEMEMYDLAGPDSDCNPSTSNLRHIRIVYRWRRIIDPDTPFVVVIRSVESQCAPQVDLAPLVPEFEFRYHRLDLIKPSYTCLYLRQLATLNFPTVYLAPRAFARPFTRLSSPKGGEDFPQVRHIMAYLLDHSSLISNPSLARTHPSVRSSVGIVERISKFWAHRSRVSKLRKFIVRRYVATDTGVMLVYPGVQLSSSYDPTIQAWYRRALANPGKVVTTGPVLDSGGAGPIVTLSRVIFEGNRTGLHDPQRDKVAAVIGVDVTYRFLSLMLSRWLPDCGDQLKVELVDELAGASESQEPSAAGNASAGAQNDSSIGRPVRPTVPDVPSQQRCLLMDDRGYIVAHPNFYTPRRTRPVQNDNINYHEPVMVADLLQQPRVVHKHSCASYLKGVIQRYYTFNLSTADVVRNARPGNSCVKYELLTIPNTNLFLGVVRERHRVGCSPRTAFCPCSTRNHQCLSCELAKSYGDCECPCQCPLDSRLGWPTGNSTLLPCPPLLEINLPAPIETAPLMARPSSIPLCRTGGSADDTIAVVDDHDEFGLRMGSPLYWERKGGQEGAHKLTGAPIDVCPTRQGQLECSAAVGCEWCSVDTSGQKLEQPFCALMSACYNGVFGEPSPYTSTLSSYLPWKDSQTDTNRMFGVSQMVGDDSSNGRYNLVDNRLSNQSSYYYDEYTYRLIELMARRSRHSNGESGVTVYRRRIGNDVEADNEPGFFGLSGSIGPVAGAVLVSSVLILFLAFFVRQRFRQRGDPVISLENQVVDQTGSYHPSTPAEPMNSNNSRQDPPPHGGIFSNDCNGDGGQPPTAAAAINARVPDSDRLSSPTDNQALMADTSDTDSRGGTKSVASSSGASSSALPRIRLSGRRVMMLRGLGPGGAERLQLLTQFAPSKDLASDDQWVELSVDPEIPPNPYHNTAGGPVTTARPAATHKTTAQRAFSTASERDSAVGSDCATTASSSSNAKTPAPGKKQRELLLVEPPLGVCIGTLILGPEQHQQWDDLSSA